MARSTRRIDCIDNSIVSKIEKALSRRGINITHKRAYNAVKAVLIDTCQEHLTIIYYDFMKTLEKEKAA